MTTGGVDSQANVTEVHESLHLDEMENTDEFQPAQRLGNFGVFSVKWSSDTRTLMAGTGGNLANILLFDVEKQKVNVSSRIALYQLCDSYMTYPLTLRTTTTVLNFESHVLP